MFLLTKDQRVEHSEFDTKYGSEDSGMDSSDMISSGEHAKIWPQSGAQLRFLEGLIHLTTGSYARQLLLLLRWMTKRIDSSF